MARLASTLLVLALLGGTAAAFAVTEGLKLEPSPILAPEIDKVFSPVCGCPTRVADVGFRLRRSDELTLAIVDSGGEVVRTLVDSRRYPRGRVHVRWDGRDEAGRIVAEGAYRPRVHLGDQHRTIVFPNEIRLDTTAPRITLVHLRPLVFSPDGDGRGDSITARYRVSEPAHALLFVDGKRRVRGRWQRPEGRLEWYGKLGGRAFRAGTYRITLAARDLAGNLSAATAAVVVRIRYIELARERIRVQSGRRFAVGVSTDARSFRWRLAGRTGIGRSSTLVLRAPEPGRYVLYVQANGRADRAVVIVEQP